MSAHISGGYAKEPPTYGKVLLKTTVGDIDIELWPKQAPKACRNFIQLVMEEYYNDCIFHRVITNFMVQTGDPTGTGQGGESAYGIPFKDEFHSRLKFSHRGIVAMANSGTKHDNKSQFFITLDKCDWLNRKHTIFGKVTGNTIYNILKFNDLEINKETDHPMIEHKIYSIEILLNPFDDITPRQISPSKTAKEKIKTNKHSNDKREEKNKLLKQMGAKNDTKLLAFGDDEEDEEEQLSLMETNNKLKKLKTDQKKIDAIESSNNVGNESSEMMDIIRAKLAAKSKTKTKKRTFSEINDDENDSDLASKKRKIDVNNNGSNDEYEMLKKQLLEKQLQRENNNDVDYRDDDGDEYEDNKTNKKVGVVAKLMEEREEYIKKTRMNKRDRNKFTLNKLNEFMETIDGVEHNENEKNKKTGKLDENTGIQFDTQSDEDGDDYDPNWFKSKLEFKKRPQDIEIYSVDDYCTIYGNSKQNINENKSNKYDRKDKKDKIHKKDKKNDRQRDYNHDRNRKYSDRNRKYYSHRNRE